MFLIVEELFVFLYDRMTALIPPPLILAVYFLLLPRESLVPAMN